MTAISDKKVTDDNLSETDNNLQDMIRKVESRDINLTKQGLKYIKKASVIEPAGVIYFDSGAPLTVYRYVMPNGTELVEVLEALPPISLRLVNNQTHKKVTFT